MTPKTSKTPEPNRWVRLYCEDWSPYQCVGKFVKYKDGTGKSRFMRHDPRFSALEVDRDAWKDCEQWEYIDDPMIGPDITSDQERKT